MLWCSLLLLVQTAHPQHRIHLPLSSHLFHRLLKAFWATATYTENAEVGEGEKTVEMTVTAEDKSIVITVKTDAETVGDMLRETSVATGSEGDYGLFVDTVNGIKADWDTDGTYWGFYVDGEFSSVGVDGVDIPTDGSLNIAFNLEKDNG